MGSQQTLCLVTCEVSGDQTGARLAHEIRRRAPDTRLIGVGGPEMARAGVEVGVFTTQHSLVGFLDAVRIGRAIGKTFRGAQRFVRDNRPDLVLLIDSELVSVPFAMWLRTRRIPAAYFFPPHVWLWGKWRMPVIARLARRFICAFRPEAELFRAAGVDTVWVGHPLRDLVQVDEDPAAALRQAGLDPGRPLVALMPGSRLAEVRALGAPMLGAARILQMRDPSLQFAIPLASEALREEVEQRVRSSGVRDAVVYKPASYAVLSQAKVAIQCSGTATLEAALLGIPAVVTYRCRPIEYFVGHYLLIRVPYIGMPNILLGDMVQPELFHKNVDAEHLAGEAWSLLVDSRRRDAITVRLAQVRDLLGPPGALRRAADALLDLLPASRELENVRCTTAMSPSGIQRG